MSQHSRLLQSDVICLAGLRVPCLLSAMTLNGDPFAIRLLFDKVCQTYDMMMMMMMMTLRVLFRTLSYTPTKLNTFTKLEDFR